MTTYKMMEFTTEEKSLINSFNLEVKISRVALIRKLMRCMEDYREEPDIYRVVNSTIRKLGSISDAEYMAYDFYVNEE